MSRKGSAIRIFSPFATLSAQNGVLCVFFVLEVKILKAFTKLAGRGVIGAGNACFGFEQGTGKACAEVYARFSNSAIRKIKKIFPKKKFPPAPPFRKK